MRTYFKRRLRRHKWIFDKEESKKYNSAVYDYAQVFYCNKCLETFTVTEQEMSFWREPLTEGRESFCPNKIKKLISLFR